MIRFNADIATAAIALVIGVTLMAVMPSQAGAQVWRGLLDLQSTAFFPSVIAVFLVIVSAVMLVRATIEQFQGGGVIVSFPRPVPVIGAIALIVAWTAAIRFAGMVPASIVAICLLGLLIEPRHWKIVLPAAVVVPFAVYYLFEQVLRILLPRGVLF